MTSHVPMCLVCDAREVQIVVNSVGSGFCSPECEQWANEEAEEKEYADSLLRKQFEDNDEAELRQMMADARYDAFLSQYDNDPSPYDGTYSEE